MSSTDKSARRLDFFSFPSSGRPHFTSCKHNKTSLIPGAAARNALRGDGGQRKHLKHSEPLILQGRSEFSDIVTGAVGASRHESAPAQRFDFKQTAALTRQSKCGSTPH